ncbi:MAG: hypothetical protein H0Z19_08255 [Archaeoglobus sp.]|uniref:hypothetical protein n=1 Tax=Archaeoglobus sp. TaxID=1872626 RepID=UPI001D3770BC|nr:hypothetical protein [Archaeoglobus sp.]MBO8180454.1 hypothetical protein [Archaeoglobus sp.]
MRVRFHWQRGERTYRIDTAPHRRNTEGSKSPEDKFWKFMLWGEIGSITMFKQQINS